MIFFNEIHRSIILLHSFLCFLFFTVVFLRWVRRCVIIFVVISAGTQVPCMGLMTFDTFIHAYFVILHYRFAFDFWDIREILQPDFPLTFSLVTEPVLTTRTFLSNLGSYKAKKIRISAKVGHARCLPSCTSSCIHRYGLR
jgi:hypothetical protein